MTKKLTAIGITCGVGSLLIGARQAGFDVKGNVEWRKYYSKPDEMGRTTFGENFPGAVFKQTVTDMTPQEIEKMMEATLAVGHPESHPDMPIYTSKGWRMTSELSVGDLVLTHKGRFKTLLAIYERSPGGETEKITFSRNSRRSGSSITLAGNHPVLMDDGTWRKAGDVKKGERITYLCEECSKCGELTPVSVTKRPTCYCGVKKAWASLSSEEQQVRMFSPHEATRRKIKKGEHDFTKTSIRQKGQLVQGRRSKAELLIADAISDARLIHQFPVGKFFVDMAIPQLKIAIEVDGGGWHRTERKVSQDEEKEAYLTGQGWTIIRTQIRIERLGAPSMVKAIRECVEEFQRITKNHRGEYKFASFVVGGLWRDKFDPEEKLYDLSVDEDNSYVAKGLVLHNCGNFSMLGGVNKGFREKRNDATDIPLFVQLVAKFRPRFFMMDDLPLSFGAFPMSAYHELLPDYDLFPEWMSNWGYGNIQRHRDRMFMLGARKEEGFVFRPGEAEHSLTLKDVIGDMGEPGKSNLPNHEPLSYDEPAQKNLSLRFIGDRPTWREMLEYAKTHWKPGQSMDYFATDGSIKKKPGCKIEYWTETDSRGLYRGASVLDGGSYKIHPKQFRPLTIRERARVQGAPDEFVFYGTELNEKGEWNPDRNTHMIRQSGKFMPVQFGNYYARQVAAHVNGEPFECSDRRILKPNPHVDEAKRWYCSNVGYSRQETACEACWMTSSCPIRRERLGAPVEKAQEQVKEVRARSIKAPKEKPIQQPRAPRSIPSIPTRRMTFE